MASLGNETISKTSDGSLIDTSKEDYSDKDALSFIISVGNGLLPFGDVQSIVGLFSDDAEAKLQAVLDQNPEAATSGMAIGTVVGLLGGPVALAKGGSKGVLAIAKYVAKGRAKGVTRRQVDEAKAITQKMSDDITEIDRFNDPDWVTQAPDEYLDEIKNFDRKWASLERQSKAAPGAKRDFFRNYVNDLSDANPLKLSGVRNPFKTIFDNELDKAASVTGGSLTKAVREVSRQARHSLGNKALNLSGPALEFFAAVSIDFASNYMYGYTNFKNQGHSDRLSKEMALYYAWEKTDEEVVAELVQKIAGNQSKFAKLIGISAEAVKVFIRSFSVDLETGNVDPEKYAPSYNNRGGLIAY